MKKVIKYILILIVIGLVGYKSVYIKKLSEVKKIEGQKFDAVTYTRKLWDERLPVRLDSSIELGTLIRFIQANPLDAFARFSNAIGIGNYRYSLVKVNGVVTAISEDDVTLKVSDADSTIIVTIATEFVYGNAIRDASGLVDIKDFTNTNDLNSISEELNKKVRTTVLPAFRSQVKQGDEIELTGAVQFNKEHISFKDLEIIPIRIKILK